jgi:hypothetical protein
MGASVHRSGAQLLGPGVAVLGQSISDAERFAAVQKLSAVFDTGKLSPMAVATAGNDPHKSLSLLVVDAL